MTYTLHFAQPFVFYFLLPLFGLIIVARWYFHKSLIYCYPLGSLLKQQCTDYGQWRKHLLYGLRLLSLLLLLLAIGKPQLVDMRSKVIVEGIDIVLVVDASGSMQIRDSSDDRRSRFDIAKEEAIRFIQKRKNDAIGLVIFAYDACSRCPITIDKRILEKMVNDLQLGDINPEGTMLGQAMITGINRLKSSQAKSKIMILLTDGTPSPGDVDPRVGIEIAKKFGIKIYTVGIGGEQEGYIMIPHYGAQVVTKVNKQLLQKIAHETSGQFFLAHNAQDMRAIYDTIDRLEKNEHEMPFFSKYYDIFTYLVLVIMALIMSELLLTTWIWFGL